jgi:hypothetical protein
MAILLRNDFFEHLSEILVHRGGGGGGGDIKGQARHMQFK